MTPKCPGQDQRYWTPEDIFDVGCPYCGREIEFWKDEPFRLCRGCDREVRNPRFDLACADWCASADGCLGHGLERGAVASPVVERLMALLETHLAGHQPELDRARAVCARVDTLLRSEKADPRVAKPAGMLAGAAFGTSRNDGAVGHEDDPRISEPEVMRGLLCGAGISEREAANIERIVRSVLVSDIGTDAESRLVWDAVQRVCQPSATNP
jgi:hypothetical protein